MVQYFQSVPVQAKMDLLLLTVPVQQVMLQMNDCHSCQLLCPPQQREPAKLQLVAIPPVKTSSVSVRRLAKYSQRVSLPPIGFGRRSPHDNRHRNG